MHHLHLAMTPMIIHIPHASTVIPPEALADYIVDRDELQRLRRRATGWMWAA